MLAVFASFAHAQRIDVAGGISTVLSSKPDTASLAFLPPAERGGAYPSASVQFLLTKHFGINGEVAVRAKHSLYNGYQEYRPAFYDVNAVYAPRISDQSSADLMAGVGGETLIFYNRFASCTFANCPVSINSNHFLAHAGVAVRYYFRGNFFFRPELHYYHVMNNVEFHSDHLFRAGASIGYTFGR